MSGMSVNHIAVLLAIGAIVPMQSFVSRPGLAETLGNGEAKGFAAIGISDSDAGAAHATAIGGIAVGPDAQAFTQDATHPCAGGSDATDCGHGNIAIGISSGATNDFAVAIGMLSKARGENSSAYGSNSTAASESTSAFGNGATPLGLSATAQPRLEWAASLPACQMRLAPLVWPPATLRPPTDAHRLPWAVRQQRSVSLVSRLAGQPPPRVTMRSPLVRRHRRPRQSSRETAR